MIFCFATAWDILCRNGSMLRTPSFNGNQLCLIGVKSGE